MATHLHVLAHITSVTDRQTDRQTAGRVAQHKVFSQRILRYYNRELTELNLLNTNLQLKS